MAMVKQKELKAQKTSTYLSGRFCLLLICLCVFLTAGAFYAMYIAPEIILFYKDNGVTSLYNKSEPLGRLVPSKSKQNTKLVSSMPTDQPERPAAFSQNRRSNVDTRSPLRRKIDTSIRPDQVERFMWMRPRSGGFNNQIQSIYYAIACAMTENYTFVLPHMFENVRQDTNFNGEGPYPFVDYLEKKELGALMNVVEPHEAAKLTRGRNCTIRTRQRVEQYSQTTRLFSIYCEELGVCAERVRKVEDTDLCVDQTVCPRNSLLGAYSLYNSTGQGFSVKRSALLQNIVMHLHPSDVVLAIARRGRDMIGGPYNALHVRRGDYRTKCTRMEKLCEEYGEESMYQSIDTIVRTLGVFKNVSLPVFVSSTHGSEVKASLEEAGVNKPIWIMEDFEMLPEVEKYVNRTDIVSLASQIIAIHADNFVGNRFSSYTTEINNRRLIRDSNAELNFF